MKTAYYKALAGCCEPALNFYQILETCRREKINRLVVEKGEYDLDPKLCAQRQLNISNHGHNGPKRIAVVIEDMADFEIDFCGSTLISRGILTPFAILNSRNITLRNVKLKNPTLPIFECRVVSHGENFVEAENICGMENVQLHHGYLYGAFPCNMYCPVHLNVEFDGITGEIAGGTADHTFGVETRDLRFEPVGENRMRIFGGTRKPPVGNVLLFTAMNRMGAGIFCERSENLRMENVDICSCYGMGILAQMCRDISLRNFNTLREDGRFCTAGADATHFVNCAGVISVEDSTFVGQLDDALNIHGFYTAIVAKTKNELFVKLMHEEAKGLRIYKPGDRIRILPRNTLLPLTEKTIKEVEYINIDITRLVLCEDTDDIEVGHAVENISHTADLVFRNNRISENRARSMLVAARGKVLIENNYFHSTGTGIYFESDGVYWYESGATTDVTIRSNHFDRCKYTGWGEACISGKPREAVEEGRYFHKNITVTGNRFTMVPEFTELAAVFDNFENVVFSDNIIEGNANICIRHVGSYDIQQDVNVTVELK